MLTPLAFQMPGIEEWIVIGVIGLLLFGKRLPEVGRSLGKGIVEFKKGLKGIEDDVSQSMAQVDRPAALPGQKFDPYTGQPINQPKFDPFTGKPLGEPASTPTSMPPTT
jgi:sec-independent protein translocase protein TatA